MIEISNRTVIFNDFDEATDYEKKLIGTEQEYEKIIKNGTVIFLFEYVEVREKTLKSLTSDCRESDNETRREEILKSWSYGENAKKSANETHEKISKSWGFGEQISMF